MLNVELNIREKVFKTYAIVLGVTFTYILIYIIIKIKKKTFFSAIDSTIHIFLNFSIRKNKCKAPNKAAILSFLFNRTKSFEFLQHFLQTS